MEALINGQIQAAADAEEPDKSMAIATATRLDALRAIVSNALTCTLQTHAGTPEILLHAALDMEGKLSLQGFVRVLRTISTGVDEPLKIRLEETGTALLFLGRVMDMSASTQAPPHHPPRSQFERVRQVTPPLPLSSRPSSHLPLPDDQSPEDEDHFSKSIEEVEPEYCDRPAKKRKTESGVESAFEAAIQIPGLPTMKGRMTASEDGLLSPGLEAMPDAANTADSFHMYGSAQPVVRLPLFSAEQHQESQRESVQTKIPLAFDNAGNQMIISLPPRDLPEAVTGPAVRPLPTAAGGYSNSRDQFYDVYKTDVHTKTQLHEQIQQDLSMINKECRLNIDRPLHTSGPCGFSDAMNLRSKGYGIDCKQPKRKRRISKPISKTISETIFKTEDTIWSWEEIWLEQQSGQSL